MTPTIIISVIMTINTRLNNTMFLLPDRAPPLCYCLCFCVMFMLCIRVRVMFVYS